MRRRRVSRRPFARLYYPGGRGRDHAADSVAGGELFVAAGRLIEVAGKRAEAVSELIEPEVAERVLARALATGGEFAEVFAERRGGLAMAIDESRIESVQSGAEQGAGRARRRAAAPPTSPTSTASTPPTSSGPPTRPPRRCAASGPSRGR